MAVALSSLRIEAQLDASAYLRGAEQKSAADTRMVDSGAKVAGSIDLTERKLATSGGAIERFVRQNDQAYRANAQFEAGQRTLQRALDAGAVSQDTYNRQLQLLNERYNAALIAAQKAELQHRELAKSAQAAAGGFSGLSNAAKLSYTDIEILRAGVVNTIQSLASGESAARTFQTQIFQTAPALGGLTRALGLTAAALAPIALGVGAVVAAFGALALGVGRLAATQQNIREFNLELAALGTSGETSGAALQQAFQKSGIAARRRQNR
jgi:hypothetical protein